jgi:hypothetical protein
MREWLWHQDFDDGCHLIWARADSTSLVHHRHIRVVVVAQWIEASRAALPLTASLGWSLWYEVPPWSPQVVAPRPGDGCYRRSARRRCTQPRLHARSDERVRDAAAQVTLMSSIFIGHQSIFLMMRFHRSSIMSTTQLLHSLSVSGPVLQHRHSAL